jgi:hypothetical protein
MDHYNYLLTKFSRIIIVTGRPAATTAVHGVITSYSRHDGILVNNPLLYQRNERISNVVVGSINRRDVKRCTNNLQAPAKPSLCHRSIPPPPLLLHG